MIQRLAKRIGASYIWGLVNFIAGVAVGNAEGSLITQVAFKMIHYHH